jgi:hypothetical protein
MRNVTKIGAKKLSQQQAAMMVLIMMRMGMRIVMIRAAELQAIAAVLDVMIAIAVQKMTVISRDALTLQ